MKTANRPWLECVDLPPDVFSEELSEDVFALDLGAPAGHLIGRDLSASRPRSCRGFRPSTGTRTASSGRPTSPAA